MAKKIDERWKPATGKGKRKAAVYLRASQGKGTKIKAQWELVRPFIEELVDKGYLKVFDYNIKGKSWSRAWRGVKLDKRGDVFNEGIKSGFSIAERPVLANLFEQVNKGKYDTIIVWDLERLGRNYMDLAYTVRDPVVEDGAEIYSLKDDQVIFDDIDFLERLGIILGIEVGGEKKKGEIESAKKASGTKRVVGYSAGTMPSIGQKRKTGPDRRPDIPWRSVWLRMKSEEAKGNVHPDSTPQAPRLAGKVTGQIALDFNQRKTTNPLSKNFNTGNNAWTKKFYARYKQMEELGVIDDWLDVIDELREYALKAKGENQVNKLYRLFGHVSGWVLYPAGVFFEDFDKNRKGLGTGIVVNYPNPKGMIEKLYEVDDPRILPNYEVSITEVDEQPPEFLQVQLTDSSARKS